MALGGGHGLHASLSALRLLTDDLTAIVTVADDGGSSGRIRRELKVLPPGDLRMALAALAGTAPEHRAVGRPAPAPARRLRRAGRPPGRQPRADRAARARAGSDEVARSRDSGRLRRRGGPGAADEPDAARSGRRGRPVRSATIRPTRQIRGQSSIAATPGRVRTVRLLPAGAPACAAAVDAVREADVVVLGPGSWFTSVIPHLLLRELGTARRDDRARWSSCSTSCRRRRDRRLRATQLLRLLREHAEPCRRAAGRRRGRRRRCGARRKCSSGYVSAIGARLVVSRLASDDSAERHDPERLSGAIRARGVRDRRSDEGAQRWR